MKERAIVFALLVLLAGCGQQNSPPSPAQSNKTFAEEPTPPMPPGASNVARKLSGPPMLPKVKLPTATNAAKLFKLTTPEPMVTLTWDVSTDPSVNGYRVYQGGLSRAYTNSVPVNPATNNVVVLPVGPGGTYYFAATSTSTNGLESEYSNEVTYTAPSNQVNYVVVYVQSGPSLVGPFTNISFVTLTNPAAPNLFFKLAIVSTNSPP